MPRRRERTRNTNEHGVEPESVQEKARRFGLRTFVVDPGSTHFDWASNDLEKETRLDRLVNALEMELVAHRPVALGIMTPTWIPITRKGAATYEARELDRTSLVDLNALFLDLRSRISELRAFVRWREFVEAPSPKLYVWEACRPKLPADRRLPDVLAAFVTATTAEKHGAVVATEGVLSLVGALLLGAGLTNDTSVLGAPCVLVGQPTPDVKAIRRDQKRRDEEFVGALVKLAIKAWFKEHGRPELGEIYASDLPAKPPTRSRGPRRG